MKRLKYLFAGILAVALTGCGGQTVVESLNINTNQDMYAPGKGFTAVVLPFADYSKSNTIDSAHRRNLRITESITDELVVYGFGIPVQEDVFQYLAEEEIISLAAYNGGSGVTSMKNELEGDWSGMMKDNIRFYINQQSNSTTGTTLSSPGTHGLTKKKVGKIGREFGADYIIRGRILEYKSSEDVTWNPMRKGFFPVVVGSTTQMLYGFSRSDDYDFAQDLTTGATLGVVAGQFTGWPINYSDGALASGTPLTAGSVVWGLAGAGIAAMAKNGGKVDQAVVQLRIWVQDAVSGKVVWTNRIQVSVSPKNVFSDDRYDTLFNEAINKGTTTLMNDFIKNGL